MRADRIGNKNQYFISTFMSISVIYLLEIIYITQDNTELCSDFFCLLHCFVQMDFHTATV